MAETLSFYAQQAENCAKAASQATLTNERDKFLQAQAAWQALADKTALGRAQAAKREAERNVAMDDTLPTIASVADPTTT